MSVERQARAGANWLNRAGGKGARASTSPPASLRHGPCWTGYRGVAGDRIREHGPGVHARRDARKPRPVGCRPADRVVGGARDECK